MFAFVVLVLGFAWWSHSPRPSTGQTGAPAEALATRMEEAVDLEAWAATRVLRWNFGGRNDHLWDRNREVAQVRWDDNDVLLYAGSPRGRAFVGGEEVRGEAAVELLQTAHERWINDSFWLNPLAKFRDPGVTLSAVTVDGEEGLLVEYSSGGVTPGDAYLWIPGDDGRPVAWRMWVSIIPIGGVRTSWDGWRTLSTGAEVATIHETGVGLTLELSNVAGAESIEALLDGGEDPFAPLFE